MPIVNCPGCQRPLRSGEELAGKQVMCPACKKVFRVPEAVVEVVPVVEAVPEPEDPPAPPGRTGGDPFDFQQPGPDRGAFDFREAEPEGRGRPRVRVVPLLPPGDLLMSLSIASAVLASLCCFFGNVLVVGGRGRRLSS